MGYSKLINSGYIMAISNDSVLPIAISKSEYDAIKDKLSDIPVPEDGTAMMLKNDLTWESVHKEEIEELTPEQIISRLEEIL